MAEEVKAKSEEVPDEAEGFSEKEKAANRPAAEPRDWVGEAVKCFIKDVKDLDPTDPVKAVEAYFEKNATDELKARCKAEGKDAKGCWRFIEAVARKALGGSSGHIDPSAIYAIAMHWFEDVPKDWNMPKVLGTAAEPKKTASAQPQAAKPKKPKKPAETPSEKRKEKERAKKAAAKKAAAKKKAAPQVQQGFFFNLLETPAEAPEQEGGAE